eukprot:gene28440-31582_t
MVRFQAKWKGRHQVNTDAIKGRHVQTVDDLADTGLTLAEVKRELLEAGAASVKALVLLDKAERRNVDISLEYIGGLLDMEWTQLKSTGLCPTSAQAKFMK